MSGTETDLAMWSDEETETCLTDSISTAQEKSDHTSSLQQGIKLSGDIDWQSGKAYAKTNLVMLDEEIATDITFVFTGSQERVKAHRFILMSRSNVFFAMFTSCLQEPDKDIEIKDIEPDIFKEFLRYIYCEVPNINETNALHLLYAAEKYNIKSLTTKCNKFLAKNINERTVALILDQTHVYASDLSKLCIDFLSKSDKDLNGLQHHHVSKETLEIVLTSELTDVSELSLFKTCNHWAETECEKNKLPSNGENKRLVLGAILNRIPFCSMSPEDFASHVSPKEMLTLQEEVEVFRYIASEKEVTPPFPHKGLHTGTTLNEVRMKQLTKKGPLFGILPIPNEIHGYDQQNESFKILIQCEMMNFKIIGFSFQQAGNFKFKINETWENFDVPNDNMEKHLSEPFVCGKHVWLKVRHGRRLSAIVNKTFPTVFQQGTRKLPCRFVVRSYYGKTPFDSIIVSL